MFHFAAFNPGPVPDALTHNNIVSIQAHAAPSPSERFIGAFCDIVPRWQEARERSSIGLYAVDYGQHIGRGSSSHSRCSALVGPCISDFIADVELNARRALSPNQQRYFFEFYGKLCQQLDGVSEEHRGIDAAVREKLGRRLIDVGIFPTHLYLRKVDVRIPRGATPVPASASKPKPKPIRLRVQQPENSRFAKWRRCSVCNASLEEHASSPCCTLAKHAAVILGVVDISAAADFTPPDRFLTAKEAADILPLHPVTILRWAREGRIPHIKLGRKVVFPLAQLTAWLEAQSGYTDSAVRAA